MKPADGSFRVRGRSIDRLLATGVTLLRTKVPTRIERFALALRQEHAPDLYAREGLVREAIVGGNRKREHDD